MALKRSLDEEDFPRGRPVKLSAEEIREAESQAEAEFYKEGRKRIKKNDSFADAEETVLLSGNVPKFVQLLRYKSLALGMKIWGAIAEINRGDMVISLPNGLRGFVNAEEASDYISENSDNNKENFCKSLFHIGQLVACTVIELQQKGDKNENKRLSLSLRPSRFYGGLTIERVHVGQIMTGCVKSIEDHGFILSFGSSSVSGFILNRDYESSNVRKGQLVEGIVSSIDKKRGVVNMSVNSAVSAAVLLKEHEELSLDDLLPGSLVQTRVKAVIRNGLLLSFLTYFSGTVDIFHLEDTFASKSWADAYSENQRLKARVLYVDRTTKSIGLTLRTHLIQKQTFFAPEVGDGHATIRRVDPSLGLLVELPGETSSAAGYVHIGDASDERIEKLEKIFKEGKRVKARVTGFRMMDGLLTVSLKESVVKGLVVRHADVKPGMLVNGTVTTVEPFGAFVSLGPGLKALCPLQHMSELQRLKPNSKFTVGSIFKFRILGCDPQTTKICVTHKKTLISSKLPLITSYEGVVEGLVTHGWIKAVKDYGCIVGFYNDVKGLVYRSELGVAPGTSHESEFRSGQVVKCRVIKIDAANQKLTLSFNMTSRSENFEKSSIKVGDIVSASITEIGEEQMNLKLENGLTGTMSHAHLSDTPVHAEQLRALLKPGYKFERLIVLDMESSRFVLSAKFSLLKAAGTLPSVVTELSPHAVIPGFIVAVQEKFCLVRFLGHLTGVVYLRNAADDFIKDPSGYFQVGQSVRAQIIQVDPETNKIMISLKQSACHSTDASLIEGYFLEEEKIAELKGVSEWPETIGIGKSVDADIQDLKDYGVILNLKSNADIVGFATHYQVDTTTLQLGTLVKARVLDVVKGDGIVDLTLRQNLFPRFKKKKKTDEELQKLQLHQKVDAVVELVKDEYLVMSLPEFDHAVGFASTRDYNVRTVRPHERYTPGQRHKATVFGLPNSRASGRLLLLLADASLDIGTPFSKKQLRMHKYSAGSVVQGEILKIETLRMTVDVGNKILGKVHITEVNDEYQEGNPLKSFKVGQSVTAKILSRPNFQKSQKLELSLRRSELSENNVNEGEKTRSLITFETIAVGQIVTAYVQEVSGDFAWMLLTSHLRGRLFILDSSSDLQELERFKDRFEVGDAVRCRVIKINHEKTTIDLSVRDVESKESGQEEIKEGDIIPGRISRVHPGSGGINVQISVTQFGRVHVTHLGDVWLDNPASLFVEAKFVRCKVLEVKKETNARLSIDLSLKPSLGASGGFESFLNEERSPPTRKIGSVKDLKLHMEVEGFVKTVTEKGCFVTLAPRVDAKILMKNLSDSYVEDPYASFPAGKLVKGRIISVEPLSGFVEMSLKSTLDADSMKKHFQDFHTGDVVSGCVRRIEKFGVFITLDNSDIAGLCHVSEVSDDFIQDIGQNLKAGSRVQAKILKVDAATQRISLGMKASYLGSMNSHVNEDVAMDDANSDGHHLDTSNHQFASDGVDVNENEMDSDDEMSDDEKSDSENNEMKNVEPLQVDEESEEEMEIDEPKQVAEDSTPVKKKDKKRVKEAREASIRAAEEKLLEGDQPPETIDDFERLVHSSPNSSFVWIKYMAFLLHLADADKARAIADRALETINFREEDEKLNIWIAYLNLENVYGNPPKESVANLFQRALTYCDPKKLHMAILGIYEKSNQHDLFDEYMKKATAKFKSSTKVWLKKMSRGDEDVRRKTFEQALLALPRHKHIKFISRSAILEFKSGTAERGRAMFEGVLRNYPKRTDLWSVYLDQEIRVGDESVIRNLFERVTCLDLAPKKMKFVLKKYLDYEKANGDEERIEHVKAKAKEYVDSKLG